jgi:hypothetical protein
MSTLPKRKRKKKTKNQYFTQATEDAIVRYNAQLTPKSVVRSIVKIFTMLFLNLPKI